MHKSQDGHQWALLEWSREEDGAGFRFRLLWVCPCGTMKTTETFSQGLDEVGESGTRP